MEDLPRVCSCNDHVHGIFPCFSTCCFLSLFYCCNWYVCLIFVLIRLIFVLIRFFDLRVDPFVWFSCSFVWYLFANVCLIWLLCCYIYFIFLFIRFFDFRLVTCVWLSCCLVSQLTVLILFQGVDTFTTRYRVCDNPPPYGDGADCVDAASETNTCTTQCPGNLTSCY